MTAPSADTRQPPAGRQNDGPPTALAGAEAHVRALLHGSRDLHVLVDHDGTVCWASDRINTMLGYTVDETVGRPARDLVHPDDLSALDAGFRAVLRSHAAGPGAVVEPEPLVARLRARHGAWVRVEGVCSALITEGGELGGVLVDVRDATWPRSAETAVRHGEERYRALVQHSADAVVVIDANGRVGYASPTVERLFGWPPAQVEGREWLSFVDPGDHDAVAGALAEMAGRGPDDPHTGLFRVRHRGGGHRWAEGISVNHLDNPAVSGIVTNVRDVSGRLEAEEALRASEARIRTIVSGAYDVTALLDAYGTVQWVTPNCMRLLGCPPEAIVGHSGLDWVHPDDLDDMVEALTIFAAGAGVSSPAPIRMRHTDGAWRDVEVVATDFLQHAQIAGIAVNLRDIGERVAAERERERLNQIFAMTSDLVSTYDVAGHLVYLNDAARRFLGVGPDEPIEQIDVYRHLPPSVHEAVEREVRGTIGAGRPWTGELEVHDASRTLVPMQAQLLGHRDGEGNLVHVSAVLRDISERKSFERRLQYEATHDPLTALPNRTLLLDRLGTALARGRRNGTGVALLFCDLDHFKVVNDSLGHSVGDQVLTEVARRLEEQLRPGDTVARFGGDEFVVLAEDCHTTDDAVAIAARIDEAMGRSFSLHGSDVFVGVSIGISLAAAGPGESPDPEDLIRDADAAMYRAKERGRGCYQVFEPHLFARALDRLDLESALRRAIERGELDLVYQPVVAVGGPDGGRIVGAEALVRWDHPQRGRLLPGEFIGLAEDNGTVHELGAWVLDTACQQLADWLRRIDGSAPFSLAVNLSGRQLEHPGLVDVVGGALRRSGIAPGRLDLEVTESVLMRDATSSAALLGALKDLGVNVAIDDFGTGYSSLAYLRRFPVDRLKIDRSFVAGLGVEAQDSAIVGAVVDLAHALGLVAVGEGVETAAQLGALRALGCDLAQGYLFAGPVGADELGRRLTAS